MAGPLNDATARNLAHMLVNDQLILFVGAGISRQARSPADDAARMPLWSELANSVAASTGEKLEHYSGQILDLFDGIAQSRGRGVLEDAIRHRLRDDAFEPSQVHRLIADLPFHMVYTTNYDSLLDRAMGEGEAIVGEGDYDRLRRPTATRPRLIHLHGDLRNMHTLTGEDFNLWSHTHPVASTHLTQFGLRKTFLFIGYSNSDPHLRHGIFPLLRSLGQGREGRNYAWMWNITEQQVRLLDRSSRLEATCMRDDGDWALALEQIKAHLKDLGSTVRSKTLRATSSATAKQPTANTRINGYKLFYHRTSRKLSLKEAARRSGMHWGRIQRLERVRQTAVGAKCFQVATRQEIEALEEVLGCKGTLEVGLPDDFLATYIMYYRVNAGALAKHSSNSQLTFKPETRAVVFDFGGTLTLPSPPHNTWERIWLSVGYAIQDAADLHRLFNAGRIDHQEWCDSTCRKLRDRGFSKTHLDEIASVVQPVPGLAETFQNLHGRGIPIYIVSGSIRHVINKILGELTNCVDDIKCNHFDFDADGVIREIRGHRYDFEGKAHFIEEIIKERRCEPLEVLFVGNSLNDHWAIRSGARTLCVNPSHTDFTNSLIWSNYIKEMRSLTEILQHI